MAFAVLARSSDDLKIDTQDQADTTLEMYEHLAGYLKWRASGCHALAWVSDHTGGHPMNIQERTRRANLARLADRADAWRIDHWVQSIPWNRAPGETISTRDRDRLTLGFEAQWVG
jgi:hypothetical protein